MIIINTKKRIAFISTLCVLIVSVVALCFVALESHKSSAVSGSWDSYVSVCNEKDSANYYKITSARQLAYINKNASNYYTANPDNKFRLYANIDMSAHYWNPSSSTFYGTFDGNGYTISGITIDNSKDVYVGFFSKLKNANILNLKLIDFNISCNKSAGVLAGYDAGSTINNVQVNGCTINCNTIAGCLIGHIVSETGESKVTNISDCRVYNSKIIINNSTFCAGYFVGEMYGKDSNNRCQVKWCVSSGNEISLNTADNYISSAYVGGLIGYGKYVDLVQCANSSNIKIQGGSCEEYLYIGGIFGSANNCTIASSYNTGNMFSFKVDTVENQVSDDHEVTFGNDFYGYGVSNYYYTVKYKEIKESILASNIYTGGIVGYNDSTNLENCYNSGEIAKDNQAINMKYSRGLTFTGSNFGRGVGAGYEITMVVSASHSINGVSNSSIKMKNCYTNQSFSQINLTAKLSVSGKTQTIEINASNYKEYVEKKISCGSGCYIELTYNHDEEYGDSFCVLACQDTSFPYDMIETIPIESFLDDAEYEIKIAQSGENGLPSDIFAVDNKINKGLPHLKYFYWQDFAKI